MLRRLILLLRLWLVTVAALSVGEYRDNSTSLSTLAFRDVNAVLASLGDVSPIVIRDTLREVLPEVLTPYMTAAGELAATWYEDLRAEALSSTFYATTSSEVTAARVESLVGYGVKPLFGQSSATVLSLLAGGVQRIISGAARDTIVGNIGREKGPVGFARIPAPGTCAFCGMLASRGAVYRSQASAGGVVGAGVDASVTAGKVGGQGKGVKARGARALGSDRYHDFCKCVATAVFVGTEMASLVGATRRKYTALYDDAFELNGNGSISAKETLAQWRQVHGTK